MKNLERYIPHSPHILPRCERDSETKYRKRTAHLTGQGASGMNCLGVNTMLSSTRSRGDTCTYVYSVCILWHRDVLLKLISQISILCFALCFKVILEHMNGISFVQDDLENQLHPFTCTTEAHILGILDSQHPLLNFTISLAFPCKHTFKNQGEN